MKRPGDDRLHWSNADFAREFLRWLVDEYPAVRGGTVCVPDIREHFFPRFQAESGRRHLRLGALLRGLGQVAVWSETPYTDAIGRRRSLTEYAVPSDLD